MQLKTTYDRQYHCLTYLSSHYTKGHNNDVCTTVVDTAGTTPDAAAAEDREMPVTTLPHNISLQVAMAANQADLDVNNSNCNTHSKQIHQATLKNTKSELLLDT